MLGKTFRGGVHPDECKHYAPHTVYEPRGELVYPLAQHIGKPATPLVRAGDRVLVGQKIAERDGYISSCIHSSVSGTVKTVERRATVMGAGECIVVESDGKYELYPGVGEAVDPDSLSPEQIIARVREAGVVGLGGAAFPTPVKLEPKDRDAIEYVILNGAECEPYITCDDDLMRQKAPEIVEGLRILLKIFPNAEGVILIEKNKPEAIAAMQKAIEGEEKMRIHVAPVKYPQGGERAVVKVVAGKDTKLSQLPADVGCLVDNVATVYAIYEAVCRSTPLFRRLVTVSGTAVRTPGNFLVRAGTSCAELLEAAGGLKEGAEAAKALSGGPMMGIAMASLDVPLQKSSGAIVLLAEDEAEQSETKLTECIRCGRCVHACPMGLSPLLMAVAALRGDLQRYEQKLYGLECSSCGSCTWVCPAKRPLMQTFKDAKDAILSARRK